MGKSKTKKTTKAQTAIENLASQKLWFRQSKKESISESHVDEAIRAAVEFNKPQKPLDLDPVRVRLIAIWVPKTASYQEVESVEAWVLREYRADRQNRVEGERELLISSREEDIQEEGYTLISHHDAKKREVQILIRDLNSLPKWCENEPKENISVLAPK